MPHTAGPSRPNIVLINCDDLGYGDIGCYGSTLHSTPAIDRLAAEGMRFTDFYQASPVCSPSRAALLTACYPPRIGMADFDGLPVLFPGHPMGLDPSERTIAGALTEAGYATKLVGKWHCGDQPEFLPTAHGFDSFFGLPYSNDMGRQSTPGVPPIGELFAKWGLTSPFGDDLPPLPLMDGNDVLEQQPEQAGLTARYVGESVRFIRTHAGRRPFFLYLAHLYVHLPIYVQERFAASSRNGRYGAAVETIDWATAVLLAELEQAGVLDRTVVIFTSDNGSRARDEGGSNAPLRGMKGETWEGGMRVPGIVRWPGRVAAASECAAVVTSMDLFPTLAAAAGTSAPAAVDGRDIGPLLEGGAMEERPFWFYRGLHLEAVRRGRWKLHVARAGTPVEELYDLVADVGEMNDVASSWPGVVAALNEDADVARRELGDARLGIRGAGVRPPGRVAEGRTLTSFDPAHPYYVAEYDLSDRG